MNRVFRIVGVAALCLPMLFVGWLLLAARWSKMDAMTMQMPEGLRSLVVQGVLQHSNDGPNMQRALKLDAQGVKDWQQQRSYALMASNARGTPPALQQLYKQQVDSKRAARALCKRAQEQEKAGQECAAEDSYTEAAGKDPSSEVYAYAEGLGRAGLKCGDLPGARAGLESAILKETDFIKGTDVDQLTGARDDLLKDREYLVVVYQKEHEDKLARQVCSDMHPEWTSCACKLSGSDVACASR